MNFFNKAFNGCKKGIQQGLSYSGYVADKVRVQSIKTYHKVKGWVKGQQDKLK